MCFDINRVFFACIFIIVSSCSGRDYIESLPGGYQFISESNEQSFIYGKGDEFIPCTVIDYVFDDNFILICQKPSEPCIHTDATGLDVENVDIIQFWIVDIREDKLLGPFILTEYLQKRNNIGVPERLTLKLEI